MCNLAGYAGGERAAPVLVEMMKKQEGFGGGYSSGIVTIDEGKLHYAKCVGDFSELSGKHDAESLPGSAGIAHSRSKGSGGREWAHPFLSCKEEIAHMENGHTGYYEKFRRRHIDDVSRELMEKGHVYRSATSAPGGAKTFAGEKKWAHGCEVDCHVIEEFMKQGEDVLGAIEAMCMEIPCEIAGLTLHAGSPGEFFGMRFNQPLMLGKMDDSVYAATTALAFPEGQNAMNVFPVPVNSVFSASAQEIKIIPFHRVPGKVSDNIPWLEAGRIIAGELDSGKTPTIWNLKEATAGLWEEGEAPQKDYLVYEILRRMKADGKIMFETVFQDGEEQGTKAPEFRVCVVEKGPGMA